MSVALRAGIAAVLLAAHLSLPGNAAAQSVTKPGADLIKEVGVAAYDAIRQIPETDVSGFNLVLLMNLAAAQIAAGDKAGALGTLGGARELMTSRHPSYVSLLVLLVRAGDRRGALEALQRLPDTRQFQALGRLAAVQMEDGNLAGAEAAIEMIEELHTKSSQDTDYEIALGEVGKALAAQGDVIRAQALEKKIGSKITKGLLAEIAKAQHRGRDQQGASETIKELRKQVEAASGNDPLKIARGVAVASADAGDVDGALALVAAVTDEPNRNLLQSELIRSLARAGMMADARRVADVSASPGNFMLIGELEQRAGDCEHALVAFRAGQVALGSSTLQPYERARETNRIVNGLIACGVFAEAVTASQDLDEPERPAAILRIIKEEAKRDDRAALKATVPVMLGVIKASRSPDLSILGDVVTVLLRAGMVDDAETVFDVMQSNARRRVEWQLVDDLNAVRRAQIALGDKEGAERTQKAIDETRERFVSDLARTTAGGANANFARAMELLLQASMADDAKAEAELMREAMKVLGSDGQAIIPLMGIVARFSPQAQKVKAADDAIARGDIAAALAIVDSMPGRQKDAALPQVVKGEIAAGRLRQAMEAANAIRNPVQRATALVDIVRAAAPKAP